MEGLTPFSWVQGVTKAPIEFKDGILTCASFDGEDVRWVRSISSDGTPLENGMYFRNGETLVHYADGSLVLPDGLRDAYNRKLENNSGLNWHDLWKELKQVYVKDKRMLFRFMAIYDVDFPFEEVMFSWAKLPMSAHIAIWQFYPSVPMEGVVIWPTD